MLPVLVERIGHEISTYFKRKRIKKSKKKKPKRIANKCDHCGAYGDQACVSACQTGALIEISAYDLFRERSPAIAIAARAGYDTELEPDRREVLPTYPFTEGVDERSGGSAKVRRGRWGPLLLWTVGIVAWLVALAEVLLRLYAPTMSYQYAQLRASGEFPTAELGKISKKELRELADSFPEV